MLAGPPPRLPWLRPGSTVWFRVLAGRPSLFDAPIGRREWLRFQEAEYKFFEHHSTWAQAQRICTWFQAELTSVHSQAELDFLGHNLQKVGIRGSRGWGLETEGKRAANPYPPFCLIPQFSRGQEQHWWIGLHTLETDGRFRWEPGGWQVREGTSCVDV